MTHALAAIAPPTTHPALQAITPTAFIDGAPEPALQVLRYTAELPTDARQAVLAIDPASDTPLDLNGRAITLALPHALSDGQTRWQVLLTGTARQSDRVRASRRESEVWVVRDQCLQRLEEPADALGVDRMQGLTLGDCLNRLATLIQAEAVFACHLADLDTLIQVDTGSPRTIGRLLAPALQDAGLRIAQSLTLQRDRVRRTLSVMPARVGRRIALPWPDAQGRGGMVLNIDADAQPTPPRQWIALGDRPQAEDTFALVPGWDPALTGRPDSDYARLTSTDFSRFGSVYRAWALNEDGAFTGPPFNQGPAYDAAALFDAPAAINQPLRLGDCLTQDASGLSIAPVIESSTDSGANWSAYPGQAQVMPDRAGVFLTDDTLPAAVLAAAKADTLRLRVTATLTGPSRIEHRRWDGNPFAGAGPTRQLRFIDRFGWRRVLPTSRHADAIAAGQLPADRADDRAALANALIARIARSPGSSASATVELAGAWTALRVGDQVQDLLRPGLAIDNTPTAFHARPARVHQIQIDFGVATNTPRTRLRFD